MCCPGAIQLCSGVSWRVLLCCVDLSAVVCVAVFQCADVMYYCVPQIGEKIPRDILDTIVDVSEIPGQFVLLLGKLSDREIDVNFPKDIVTYTLSQNVGHDDYMVIMLASQKSGGRVKNRKPNWGSKFVGSIMKRCVCSVKGDGTKHHGCSGHYYGFFNTAKYAMKDKLSYGPFATNSSRPEQDHIGHDVEYFAQKLDNIIKDVVVGGQSVTQVLVDISNKIGIDEAKIKCIKPGMVCAFACRNAVTRDSHIEKDCSYTMIATPEGSDHINDSGMFCFEFDWNNNGDGWLINLGGGTVLYYCG